MTPLTLLRDILIALVIVAVLALIAAVVTGWSLPAYGRILRLMGIGAGLLGVFGGTSGPMMMNSMGAQSSRTIMNAARDESQRRWYTLSDNARLTVVLVGAGVIAFGVGSLLA